MSGFWPDCALGGMDGLQSIHREVGGALPLSRSVHTRCRLGLRPESVRLSHTGDTSTVRPIVRRRDGLSALHDAAIVSEFTADAAAIRSDAGDALSESGQPSSAIEFAADKSETAIAVDALFASNTAATVGTSTTSGSCVGAADVQSEYSPAVDRSDLASGDRSQHGW